LFDLRFWPMSTGSWLSRSWPAILGGYGVWACREKMGVLRRIILGDRAPNLGVSWFPFLIL